MTTDRDTPTSTDEVKPTPVGEFNYRPGVSVRSDNQPQTELDELMGDYKVHNKDIDMCFNDAVAVAHIKQAILANQEKAVREARIDELRRHTKKRKHWKEEGKELEIRGWNGHINELEKRIAKLTSKESE